MTHNAAERLPLWRQGGYTGAPCLINNRRVISNDNLKVAYDEGGSVIYYDEEDEPETTHGGG